MPEGTSCDLCRYYMPKDRNEGFCYAVAQGDQPPAGEVPTPVVGKACCARWEEKDKEQPSQAESTKLADFLGRLRED